MANNTSSLSLSVIHGNFSLIQGKLICLLLQISQLFNTSTDKKSECFSKTFKLQRPESIIIVSQMFKSSIRYR